MRAVSMACSHCGAALAVAPEAESVTCTYCGTRALVERPKGRRPEPKQPDVPREKPSPGPRPAPPRKSGSMAWVGIACGLAVIVGGAASSFRSLHAVRTVVRKATESVPQLTPPPTMRWNGMGPPLLVDIDGDGSSDAIGLVRYVLDGDQMKLAAFSGRTGARLWEGASLGTYSTLVQSQTALSGTRLLLADPRGALTAYDAKTGNRLWSTALGERVDKLCAGEKENEVLVLTGDKAWHRLDRDQGTESPVAAAAKGAGGKGNRGPACDPLPNDHAERGGREMRPPEVRGMRVSRTFPGEKGVVVALGYRAPGTSVPMLAGLEGTSVRWKSDIPSGNPLDADTRQPELVTVEGGVVYLVYERSSNAPPALHAFDTSSGARLWERPLRKGTTIVMRGIAASEDRVFVSSWGHLQAFERKTGEPLYVVGEL